MRSTVLPLLLCLAACGGSNPAPQTAPVGAPVEVVIAPPEPSAPSAAPSASAAPPDVPADGAAPPTDEKARKIAEELSKLDGAIVGTLDSNDGVAVGVLTAAVGSSAGGVAGLRLGGGGGGTIQPGNSGGLAGLGNNNAGGAPGGATVVKGPVGAAQVNPVSGLGDVSNASAVIAGMSAGFRRCYNRGLQQDPAMKGEVEITATIGKNGEVVAATPSGGTGLAGSVIACIAARVSSAQFAPPAKGSAILKFKVKLSSI
ncbi:MAG: AgmX/PglI C-terminal domain-containing protein [Byssovorax sp.]